MSTFARSTNHGRAFVTAFVSVAFLWALRRFGQMRDQRLARATRAKIVASTRKFDEFGDWHFFSVAIEALRHLMRRDLTRFTASYWYKPNR